MDNNEMLKTLPAHVQAVMQQKMTAQTEVVQQATDGASIPAQAVAQATENVFEKIGHGIETAAKDVAHGITRFFSFVHVIEKIFADSKQAEPEVKQLLGEVLQDVAPFVALIKPVIESGGKNLIEDAGALETLISVSKKLVNTFETAIPAIEKNFNNLS